MNGLLEVDLICKDCGQGVELLEMDLDKRFYRTKCHSCGTHALIGILDKNGNKPKIDANILTRMFGGGQ